MSLDNPARPVVYHTLGSNRTESYPLYLATHVRSGDPTSVLPTLRRIAAEISPELRLSDIQRLDQGTSYDARGWKGFANFILLVSAIALVLSLAGVYAIIMRLVDLTAIPIRTFTMMLVQKMMRTPATLARAGTRAGSNRLRLWTVDG